MAKAAAAKVHETIDVFEIPVPIPEAELQKHSVRLSEVVRDIQSREDERRRTNKVWNEEHKELKSQAQQLSAITLSKAAPKKVRAKRLIDFDEGVVRFLDPRSKKLLYQREVTKADHQLEMPGTQPKRTGGDHVSDKAPAGDKPGKRARGPGKTPDLGPTDDDFDDAQRQAEARNGKRAPTPEAGGDPSFPPARPTREA